MRPINYTDLPRVWIVNPLAAISHVHHGRPASSKLAHPPLGHGHIPFEVLLGQRTMKQPRYCCQAFDEGFVHEFLMSREAKAGLDLKRT